MTIIGNTLFIGGGGSSVNVQTNKAYTVSAAGTPTISPDSGYDAMDSVALTVPAGSATTPTTTITVTPTISINASGVIGATVNSSQNVTPTISAGWVSSGTAGTITAIGINTYTMTTQGAQTITPTTVNQTIASGQYLTGTQTIKGDANLTAGNIKNGVSIFGVTGTLAGGSYTLIATQDYTVNTTSTSATSIGTINLGSSYYTSDKLIYVRIRDKAGIRNGYFVGSDTFFINPYKKNGQTTNALKLIAYTVKASGSSGTFTTGVNTGTNGYGVYAYSLNSSGQLAIYRRYNSTYSLTINGTYEVKVYTLDYCPDQGNPYNFSYS